MYLAVFRKWKASFSSLNMTVALWNIWKAGGIGMTKEGMAKMTPEHRRTHSLPPLSRGSTSKVIDALAHLARLACLAHLLPEILIPHFFSEIFISPEPFRIKILPDSQFYSCTNPYI